MPHAFHHAVVDVARITALHQSGVSTQNLMKRFNVSRHVIMKAVHAGGVGRLKPGRSWGDGLGQVSNEGDTGGRRVRALPQAV